MKAVIYEQYGGPEVLQVREIEKPTPAAGEVLIKLHATALNSYDHRMMHATPFLVRMENGLFKPTKRQVLGMDIAGTVEAVGDGVTDFKPGDAVYSDISPYGTGGLAEYIVVPEGGLALKPERLGFEEAAAVPMAAITALRALRDGGKVQNGQHVLINGASGGVGTFCIQIAKAMDAQVTAVVSTRKVETARRLGADHVIDYKKQDFTQGHERYDVILGVNGYHPLRDYKRALIPEGIYVMVGGDNRQIFEALLLGGLVFAGRGPSQTIVSYEPTQQDLVDVRALIDAGSVSPVVDRTFPLEETAEAMRYFETGQADGKVVITMG